MGNGMFVKAKVNKILLGICSFLYVFCGGNSDLCLHNAVIWGRSAGPHKQRWEYIRRPNPPKILRIFFYHFLLNFQLNTLFFYIPLFFCSAERASRKLAMKLPGP